jgi:signal transduction histidine kinase/CheY-like chemotaxis protein
MFLTDLSARQRWTLAIGLGVVSLAFVLALSGPDAGLRRFWDNVHWTAGYLCGTLIVADAWRRAEASERRRLGAFALGLAAYTLGQLLWDLQVFLGWNPFPGPSDIFFLMLAPGVLLGLRPSFHALSPKTRVAAYLDLAAIASASLAYTVSVYLPHRGESSGLVTATMVAYPFLLFSAWGALLVLVLAQRWRVDRYLLLLLLALGFKAWLWMRWNLMSLDNALGDGLAFNVLFSYAAIALGCGMAGWRPREVEGPAREGGYFFLWNALPVVLAVGAGVSLSLAPALKPELGAIVQGSALMVIVCAIARQSLVVLERQERVRAEAQARASEERLRAVTVAQAEAQRLQALGTLAGGVAHEFNNILMAVYSQLELAEQGGGDAAESLRLAKGATNRGRDVIRRILDFARQDEPGAELAAVPVAPAVDEAQRLLRPLLPSSVHLILEDRSPGALARAQAAPLQQVLLNLGLNAGQALGDKPGEIRFGILTRYLGAGSLNGLPGGEYVELSVIDDGPGMEEAVRARAFEPFFSTKGPGRGSGLGLAVVHGIVTRWGGWVGVQSAPGLGARFTLLLPSAGVQAGPPAPEAPAEAAAWSGGEVLVLDDEAVIARALQRLLERKGYKVQAVTEPRAALAILRDQPGRFRALITDMSMPGLNGRQVLEEARRLDPRLAVLLSTGSVDLEREGGDFDACLEKPYSLEQLELALRRAAARKG